MDSLGVAHRRLWTQRISGAPFETPADVVRWLGAMQSQDYAGGKWAVAQRAHAVDDAAMDRAFADGTILRTHLLRPTWHFVLPEDIRWLLALTAPRVHALNAYYYRQLGLDDAVFAKTNAALSRALRGGEQLTRKEVQAVLRGVGVEADGPRLGYALMRAELDAIVCSGALRGKQHTYALLDERAPDAKTLSRDEALAELTLRYFTGHGPATVKDLTWWSSLTAADVRSGLDAAGARLQREVVDGRTYWFAPSSPGPRDPAPTARLLQGYDEYFVGYGESKDVVGVGGVPPLTGIHVIVLDSQVVGNWKRTLKNGAVTVEADLVVPLDTDQRGAVAVAVERYGRYLGAPTSVTF